MVRPHQGKTRSVAVAPSGHRNIDIGRGQIFLTHVTAAPATQCAQAEATERRSSVAASSRAGSEWQSPLRGPRSTSFFRQHRLDALTRPTSLDLRSTLEASTCNLAHAAQGRAAALAHVGCALHFCHAECLLEVVERALGLGVLLSQSVIEDDFVSLYQALTVLLAMFKLLVTIALDSFQKCSEC